MGTFRAILIGLLALWITCVEVKGQERCEDLPKNLTRLPQNLIPSHYKIRIIPKLQEGPEQFQAPGDVLIRMSCASRTRFIIIHSIKIAIDLSATKVSNVESGAEIGVISQILHEESQTFQICLTTELVEGQEYSLFIKFVAPVSGDELLGLYRSQWVNPETGAIRWQASTQMQDKHFRKACPGFDEPGFKATFEISLGKTEPYSTLSNMNLIETEVEEIEGHPGYHWDHYNTTVRMSTYIVAFLVSDFTSVESEEIYPGVPIKVWAVPEQIDSGDKKYGAEISAKMLKYFSTLFDFPYSLLKLDSVEVPQFAYGAMENWGLVSYGPGYLTYADGVKSEDGRRGLISIVAHELGHQWWGNLVSCQWWNDIWLNEGFAIYFDYWGMSELGPEFKPFDNFVADSFGQAMDWDLGGSAMPISPDGDEPGSGYIHHKAASIIRMMEAFLTQETLHNALKIYLRTRAYGNAIQDNLFEDIQVQAIIDDTLPLNTTIKEIMDTWTRKIGYPLVRVSSASEDTILISQEKCTLAPLETLSKGNGSLRMLEPSNEDELWYVPISYATAGAPSFGPDNQMPKLWMKKDEILVTHRPVDTNNWIVINPHSTNYYRVLYDEKLRMSIKNQLDTDHKVFSPGTRSQIVDDYFWMAFNRYDIIESALDFTTFLDKEEDLVVWKAFFKRLNPPQNLNFKNPYNILSAQPNFDLFKAYFIPKLEGALTLIGVEQTYLHNGTNVILRQKLLQWICPLGSQLCFNYASNLQSQWINPLINPVPVDIRNEIYCGIVAGGGEPGFQFALDKYKENLASGNAQQKNLWIYALGSCVREQLLMENLMGMLLDEASGIAKADVNLFFERLASNFQLRNEAFDYIAVNLQEIINYLEGTNQIVNFIRIIKDYYSTEMDYSKVENFINNPLLEDAPHDTLNGYLAIIQSNVKWMDVFGEDFLSWLTPFKLRINENLLDSILPVQ